MPDSVSYNNRTYKVDIELSGNLRDKPLTTMDTIQEGLKTKNKHGILVNVLSRNLRGKRDLHQQPYKPSRWIFVAEK